MIRSIFAHRSSFDLIQPPSGDAETEEEVEYDCAIDVMCINCNAMIPLDHIEAHSLECQQVTARVRRIDELDAIDQWCEKVFNLDSQLQKLQHDTRLEPGDRVYLGLLTSHIENVKSIDPSQFGHSKMIRDTIAKLTSLLATFKGSTIIFVYAERLKVLLLEFVRIYRDREIISQTSELKNKQLQLEFSREASAVSKNKPRRLSQRSVPPLITIVEEEEPKTPNEPTKEKIEEDACRPDTILIQVDSDVESTPRSTTSQNSSMVSSEAFISEEIRMSLDDKSERSHKESPNVDCDEPKQIEIEDPHARRKRFYAVCLSIKFNFPVDDLAQQVQTAGLYKRSVAKCIDERNWQKFIEFELGNADRWVKKNKHRRRSSKNND